MPQRTHLRRTERRFRYGSALADLHYGKQITPCSITSSALALINGQRRTRQRATSSTGTTLDPDMHQVHGVHVGDEAVLLGVYGHGARFEGERGKAALGSKLLRCAQEEDRVIAGCNGQGMGPLAFKFGCHGELLIGGVPADRKHVGRQQT
ncbi:MAG: hypothetical protein ACRYFU_06125 [Janthinobacterium lividum]